MSADSVANSFKEIWAELFHSPIHLDSALSKQSKKTKSALAQIVPVILLRPCSNAESLGVGMPVGEPWSISSKNLANWRPAQLMAERLHQEMSKPQARPVATREDFPPPMYKEWVSDWGEETASALVPQLASEPPLSLRASKRLGAQALLAQLKAGNQLPVASVLSKTSPMGVRLASYVPVLSVDPGKKLFEEGLFEIQDEGSQVMAFFALWPEKFAPLLQLKPGALSPKISAALAAPLLPEDTSALNVIDACAGAGGKTLALADALAGKGRVYAYDVSDKKLQALRRRAKRAGYNNIQAVTVQSGAEREAVGRFRRRAQIVLVDAPCSGWGVLRRNPDIKWRQDPAALKKLPEVQKQLLDVYSELVAPGGRLVFGVCTFRRAETLDVVEAFLADHPDFSPTQGGFLGPGPSDGFFMQAFERSSKNTSGGAAP